ncbi:MAG: hypothetical protein JSV02_02340 [Dehalococcoidia bacterium]|nr:MAG: hypothetical protein JSV02_02340 [Dehalococcoidia bacterium]
MDITKPNIYDLYEHPEEWTPETYNALEKAREIIEEWWLPNRRALDRLGGVLAMTEMSDGFYGLYKAIIDQGFFGRDIPRNLGGPGGRFYSAAWCQPRLLRCHFLQRLITCLPMVNLRFKSFWNIRRMKT